MKKRLVRNVLKLVLKILKNPRARRLIVRLLMTRRVRRAIRRRVFRRFSRS